MKSILYLLCFFPLLASAQQNNTDTIRVNGKTIQFTKVTKAVYSVIKTGIPVTKKETQLIAGDKRVQRQKGKLIFTLANGKKAILKNNDTEGDEYAAYTLWAWLPAVESWLVFVSGYENSSWLLVSQRTGKQTTTWGVPHFSPDNKYFICGNVDLAAGFDVNGIQLYRVEKAQPLLLWERELTDWGAENFRWKNNTTLVAERITLDETFNPKKSYVQFAVE
jgi:hypothetical protein